MKYITTDTHPEYKEGLIFEAEYPAYFVLDRNRVIQEDLQLGFIKKVEEKEYTESNMIDFVHWAVRNYSEPYYNIIMARSDFNKWKKAQ